MRPAACDARPTQEQSPTGLPAALQDGSRMSRRYSIFPLARTSISHRAGWAEAWRSPEPKRSYAAIVIGGGGHGLATAYYLAKEHGIRDSAVLEKGWLGGGETAWSSHSLG